MAHEMSIRNATLCDGTGNGPRNTKHPRLRAAGGARSLHFGRDDGKGPALVTAIYGTRH